VNKNKLKSINCNGTFYLVSTQTKRGRGPPRAGEGKGGGDRVQNFRFRRKKKNFAFDYQTENNNHNTFIYERRVSLHTRVHACMLCRACMCNYIHNCMFACVFVCVCEEGRSKKKRGGGCLYPSTSLACAWCTMEGRYIQNRWKRRI
jgi:hypothetical protein